MWLQKNTISNIIKNSHIVTSQVFIAIFGEYAQRHEIFSQNVTCSTVLKYEHVLKIKQ